MKKQRTAQVVVGLLVLVFPFVGVPLPFAWEASILYLLGAAVIALAFPLGDIFRAFFKRSCCSGEGCAVCDPASQDGQNLEDNSNSSVERAES